MSRDLRGYLQQPDKLFRRVRDAYGALRLSQAAKAYHLGRGVYRSSYKNARRLAATETNIAYYTADYLRWQQLDFVVGIRVELSNNHTLNGRPFHDICDELSAPRGSNNTGGMGCYPKDFKFTGWHPLCRCHALTILKTDDEIAEDTRRILAGEPTDTGSVNRVDDMPQEFKDWVKDNEDRIARAKSLPYFIRDNKQAVDGILYPKPTPLEIAQMRHAARTPEQIEAIKNRWAKRQHEHELIKKTANNVLKVASDYGEVDYSKLQQYIAEGNLIAMQSEAKAVAKRVASVKKQETALSDLIPDAHGWHKQFSMAELQAVHDAVEKKLDSWASLTLEEQAKKLKFEAYDFLGGNMKGVQQKYATWEVSQAAYIRKLAKVQDAIDWQNINTALSEAKTFKTKSKAYLDLISKLEAAVTSQNKSDAQNIVTDMKMKREALKKAADARAAKRYGKSADGLYVGGTPFTSDEFAKLKGYETRIIDGIMSGKGADDYLISQYHDYVLKLSEKYYDKQASIFTNEEREAMKKSTERYLARPSKNPNYIWGADLGGVYSGAAHKAVSYLPQLNGLTLEELSIVRRFTNGSTFNNCYNLRKESAYWRDKFKNKLKGMNAAEIKEQYAIIEEWSQGANYTLDRMVRYNGVTFRGLNAGGGPELRKRLKAAYKSGKPWVNNASCSTSMKHSVAEKFNGDTILIIHNKSGAYIHAISDYSSEYEIMTLRGAKYKVLAPPKRIGSRYYVELEEII